MKLFIVQLLRASLNSPSNRRRGWTLLLRAGCATVLLASVFSTSLWAAPFDKIIQFTQPDGTRIQLHGKGDEFYARFETLDGYTVVFDHDQKAYCFARQDPSGQLVSTGVQVQKARPTELGLTPGVRMSEEARKQMVRERYQRWDQGMQIEQRWSHLKSEAAQYDSGTGTPTPLGGQPSPPPFSTTGLKVGLTLLVDFSDDPATIPQAEIINLCNGDNYTDYGNNGSVKQYFLDNSGGRLTYTNVVTIYIRAPQPKSFYNDVTQDSGTQANLLIKDVIDTMKALTNYDTQILPTFDALTVDNNNEVMACNVFFAGANSGVWAWGLWPHSWALYVVGPQELSPGGKQVFRYQITDIGNSLSIGTFCHENGHMLCGYPDLYDYDYDSVGGAGYFSLMGYGNFDHNPVQIDAYLKRASGWATTTELDGTSSFIATVSANAGTNFNHFYRFQKPGAPTEYYLVENRQQRGHDALIPGPGIAVWHVDELGDRDNQSLAYNTTHANYELTLVQADNFWDLERNANPGDAQDLYYAGNPAPGYANQFADYTAPSARWWDGTASGVNFSEFSFNAPNMTLRVGTSVAAQLQVTTNYVLGGNNNGYIDPNECGDLYLVLTNAGNLGATNVQLSLSTTTPGVLIAQPNSLYPDLQPGDSGTNFTAFRISIAPSFICGTVIRLTLQIKTDQGTAARQYSLPTGQPSTPIRFDSLAPAFIPDLGQTNSTILVSNLDFSLTKLVVSLNISHTYDSDLVIRLVSPDGFTNTLSSHLGGGGQNYGITCSPDSLRTTFDDDATNLISAGSAPFLGSFRPIQPLTNFVGRTGTNLNGPWQLVVSDTVGGDYGTLQCWSLFFTPAICTNGPGECPGSDLAIGMTAQPEPVIQGDYLTYSITVTNYGPSSTKAVTVTHILPSGVGFVSAIASQGSCAQAGGVVTANLGPMSAGGTATVMVTVTASVPPGLYSSSASVSSADQPDFNMANNSATVFSHVNQPTADLAVGMSANPTSLAIGSTLTYNISVTNNGPSIATGVTLTNVFPAGLVLLGETVSQGSVSVSSNIVVCSFGTLPRGAIVSATVSATPTLEGTLVSTASLAANPNQVDPIGANNFASTVVIVGPSSDLALSLSGRPDPVVLGSNVTYAATIRNYGPSVATNVTLTESLPIGSLAGISVSVSQGSYSLNDGTLVCNLGSLASGASATVTVVAGTMRVGALTSTATVSATQSDPDPANNTASTSPQVTTPFISIVPAGASLTVESYLPPNGSVDIGEQVTIQFRLENDGNVVNSSLIATLQPSGGVTSPSGPQTYGILKPIGVPGAVPVSRPFSFTATGTNGGAVVATLQLNDGLNDLGTVSFTFWLPAVASFTNNAIINIPAGAPDDLVGPAGPYPSTIVVSNLAGQVSHVSASLLGLSHGSLSDLNVLLVSPAGTNTLLLSHAGLWAPVTDANVTFDDFAPAPVPQNGYITTGSWQPSAYPPSPVFSNDAPAGPYSTCLTNFNGLNPNGVWSLYVLDDSDGDSGSVARGWSLVFTNLTPVNPVADLGVTVTASPNPVPLGGILTNIFTISNAGPSSATGVIFSNALPAAVSLLWVTNSQGNFTTNNGIVMGSLGTLPAGATARLAVAIKLTSAVLPPGASGGFLTNSAVVSGFETDLHIVDNFASAVAAVGRPSADLALGLVASPATVVVGSNLVCTVTLTNNGPGNALNVVVTNPLPPATLCLSATASPGVVSTNGSLILASLGDLAPGATGAVSLVLAPLSAGSLTDTAQVGSDSADPAAANNSASALVSVINPAPNILPAGAVLLSEQSSHPNGAVDPGETVTVSLLLTNSGVLDTTNLVATLLASGGITPASPSAMAYGRLVHGGLAVARSFTFTAGIPVAGLFTATLQLTDGTANLGTATFTFNAPVASSFANTAAITIPDHGVAAPYPSAINISGLDGVVSKVTVSLNGLTHSFASDVNLLLVNPAGQRTLLMSHAGDGYSVTNVNLAFDDAASSSLPVGSRIATGTYLPTRYGSAVTFPLPAPAAPFSSTLAGLSGFSPNGLWALYVFDDAIGNRGSIAAGWTLNLTTVSTVNPVADLALGMSSSAASLLAGYNLAYTLRVTNLGPFSVTNVVLTDTLPASFNVVSATPPADNNGAGVLSWNLGVLDTNATATVTLVVSPSFGGSFLNTAAVSGLCADLNPANNSAQLTTGVTSPVVPELTATMVKGQLHLDIRAQAGVTCQIQASTNFLSWTPVSTNVAGSDGSISYTDPNTSQYRTRFYRAVQIQP